MGSNVRLFYRSTLYENIFQAHISLSQRPTIRDGVQDGGQYPGNYHLTQVLCDFDNSVLPWKTEDINSFINDKQSGSLLV